MQKNKNGPSKKQRSLLLYIAGDNDLSDAGLRDIEELCKEGAYDNLYIGVEIDTHGELTGSIRYEITEPEPQVRGKPKAFRKVIERLSELDSGKPTTLLQFLRWGIERFPASEYIVIIGGHGSGFRGGGRSIAIDDFGSALDMAEIEYVFKLANLDEHRIGILGFDACLMGMLEIADHFSPFARYLVGSQEVEPGDGWRYDKVAEFLKKDVPLKEVGKLIAKNYIWHYTHRQSKINITLSVICLDNTAAAMIALSELGRALYYSVVDDESRRTFFKIDNVRARTQSFRDAEYVDAIHLAQELEAEEISTDVTNACVIFRQMLGRAIMNNRVPTKSRKLRNANGLSIWFPATHFSFSVNRARYLEMSGVASNPGWLIFLDQFFISFRA